MELIYSVILFIFTFYISGLISIKMNLRVFEFLALFLYHAVFCLLYFLTIYNVESDAYFYFSTAKFDSTSFGVGTEFVVWFAQIFVQYFEFSYIDTFILFNFIGFVGLAILALLMNNLIKGYHSFKLFGFIPFLPSLSFWTSALGKDAISFTGMALALYASNNISARRIQMFFGILMMFLVRPHIALVMTISAGMAFFLGKNVSPRTRFALVIAMLLVSAAAINFVLAYSGLELVNNADDLNSAIEQRQGYNMEGGGAIDIRSMNVFERFFAYFYRPMFLDASGLTGIAASIENVILLVLTLIIVRSLAARILRNRDFFELYNVFNFFLGGILLSQTTANLGISERQKWMLMPGLLYVGVNSLVILYQSRQLRKVEVPIR